MTPTTSADIDRPSSPPAAAAPLPGNTGSAPIKAHQDTHKRTKTLSSLHDTDRIPSPLDDLVAPDGTDMEGLVSITAAATASATPPSSEGRNEISRVQDHLGTTTPSAHLAAHNTNREQQQLEPDHTNNIGVLTNHTGGEQQPQRNSRIYHRTGTGLTAQPPSFPSSPSSSPAKINGRNGYRKDQLFQDNEDQDPVDMDVDHDIAHHPSDDKYKRLKRKLKQVLEV